MNQEKTFSQMAQSIDYLCQHYQENPPLSVLADKAAMSEFHYQRVFRRWVGVSPKRFMQHLALRDVRARLLEGMPVLEAALVTGLSSPSRVHDLVLTGAGVRPRQLQLQGDSVTLTWGVGVSPFGLCVAAHSGWGLTTLLFVADDIEALDALHREWPRAQLVRADAKAQQWIDQAFVLSDSSAATDGQPWLLHVRGTNFQLKVWQALLMIPEGRVTTYGELAHCVGSAKAARAVGQAVGANPLAYLIPCHRVINGSGVVGHYRGGAERKRGLLAWEAAHSGAMTSGELDLIEDQ